MSKDSTKEIMSKLKTMYPSYKFQLKYSSNNSNYMLTAFKNGKNLGMILTDSNTPITAFWTRVHVWMKGLINIYHI